MNQPMADISRRVWETKYRYAGERTIADSWRRIARALAAIEPNDPTGWEARFLDILQDFRFLPGGRIQAGAGTARNVTLFNCFVMGAIEELRSLVFSKPCRKARSRCNGKMRRTTLLELLILKAQAMAAGGHPGAAAQINWLRAQTAQSDTDIAIGGFLLAPAPLTPEEFMAKEEARNAGKVEPGTEIDVESEEFLKAARREPSPLGEALQAFHQKYGA